MQSESVQRSDNFSSLSHGEQKSRLRKYRPRYIGLNMLTLNRFATLELAAFAKSVLPDVKIIVRGLKIDPCWPLLKEALDQCKNQTPAGQ